MTVLAVVVAVKLVLGVAPAVGAPAAPATPDEAAQFKEHFERGQVNYDLKEYAAALEEFKSAYRYRQDPVMLYNIAQCHFFLGNNEEALGFYRNYLRRAPEAPNKGAVERKIQDLEKRIASAPKPATPAAPASSPPPLTAPASPAAREPAAAGPAAPPSVTLAPPAVAPAPAPAVDLSTPAAPAPTESRSIFRRWWFWTGVGVVLLGGLAAASAASKRGQVGDCMGYSPCNKVGGP